MKQTSVLIVEDSAVMRGILVEIFSADPEIQVLGTAPDVEIARRKIREMNPDVVTLDIDLPGMDGLTFLDKIMRLRPTPVVMISGYTQENSEAALRALELGAVDVVGKSSINLDKSLHEKSDEIIKKVKDAAKANLKGVSRDHSSGIVASIPSAQMSLGALKKVVCVGASAGGVEAMRYLIQRLPINCPPILYAQHMPAEFTGRFSERLNAISELTVCQANDRMRLAPGHVYLAPGGWHLKLQEIQGDYYCRLDQEPMETTHRPSIDVLFHSAALAAKQNGIGVILTGMGKDGAEGLCAMHEAGAITIGQDEASSLIYGMPRAAFEMGGVDMQLSLRRIPEQILKSASQRRTKNEEGYHG